MGQLNQPSKKEETGQRSRSFKPLSFFNVGPPSFRKGRMSNLALDQKWNMKIVPIPILLVNVSQITKVWPPKTIQLKSWKIIMLLCNFNNIKHNLK